MIRFIFALIACLVLAPSHAAQSTVKPVATFEHYIANYDVNGDGTSTSTTEFLLRLGTKAAIETNNPWRLKYNSELQSIEVIEAYTLKQSGKRVLVPASAIQTLLSPEAEAAPEFTSFKIQSIAFPNLKPGDGVFLKFRFIWKKTFLESHFDFLEVFPVSSLWNSVQVNISAPLNYPLYWDGVDMDGGRLPDRDGRARWAWKTKVTQTIDYEAGATNISDHSPRLSVSSFPDYESLGAAYWAEAGKKVAITPAIQQLADEITKDTNEPQQHARAIYEWVNKNIRYLAIMIGRGVFIPHDVSTILQNRYGDCKDYVTILQSLLAAKGIESMPVLVRADDSFWFPKTPTIAFFNHVILYLPSLDVYVDATNANAAFGLLPQSEMGKNALLAGRKTGKILIPEGKPDDNHIRSEINLTLLENGGVKASSLVVFHGRIELLFRPLFADVKPEQSNSVLESVMRMYGLKGKGRFVEISNAHRTGESFSIKVEFDLVDTVKIPGPGEMAVPQGLDLTSSADFPKLVELEQRKTSIFAGAGRITQQYRLTFPKGLNVNSIPAGVNFVNAAGHYQSSYKNDNGVVTVTRDFVISRDVFTPKDYPAFRELIKTSVEDFKAQINYGPSKDYKPSEIVAVSSADGKSEESVENLTVLENLGLIYEAEKFSRKRVLALESVLLKNPADVGTRLLLISFYNREKLTPSDRQALVRHRIWLIEKYPEKDFMLDINPFEILAQPGSEYQALKEAWLRQIELQKNNPKILLNAAHFLVRQDPLIAEGLLKKGQQFEPDNYKWADDLGELYLLQFRNTDGDEKTRALALSVEQFEKALALNKKERSHQRDTDRTSLLRRLAGVLLEAGQLAKAKLHATELLLEFGRDTSHYTAMDIAHEGNIMLGRIALREGDIAKAKEHLLIAGRIANLAAKSHRSGFFPMMNLAKELFEKDEKQVVIEFLELCDKSWPDKWKSIKKWTAMIRKGETPSFDIYEQWKD